MADLKAEALVEQATGWIIAPPEEGTFRCIYAQSIEREEGAPQEITQEIKIAD